MNLTRSQFALPWLLGALVFAACGGDDGEQSPDPDPKADAEPPIHTGPTPDAAVESKCVEPTGEGTRHGSAPGDGNVWTAAGSPHIVTFPQTIREGETLTIEPCAVVRLEAGIGMIVSGELRAEGSAERPIRFERAEERPWGTLRVYDTGRARLSHVTLDGGGAISNLQADRAATLHLDGDPRAAEGVQPLAFVDHLTVRNSETLGVFLDEHAGFAEGSRDLTVIGSGNAPLRLWQRSATSVPNGTYTGNQNDEILLDGGGYGNSEIRGEVTFHNRGVPYRVVSKELRVGSGSDDRTPGTLTIEPGVTLRFSPGSLIHLTAYTTDEASTGTLRAIGTAAQPIVFTSAAETPAAGDWVGLTYKGTPSAQNRLEHVTIAYAGGESGISSYDCFVSPDERGFTNRAAIVIFGNEPAASFLFNSRIEHSAQDGIVRGWRGTPVDFLSSNQFSDISRCQQTFPQPVGESCPTEPPCPR